MTCTNCHKHMCWICGKAISGYDHFSNSAPCNTFTTDQVVDNTDIRQPVRYGLNPEAPQRPVAVHINQVYLHMKIWLQMLIDVPSLYSWVVVVLLFYVHGKHLRSCRNGQLT